MYSLYKKHINTIAELYLSRVKKSTISANIRNYESSLDMATNADDSSVQVYNCLLKEVNKNLNLNHEYLELKRKLLNIPKIHTYDVYTNTSRDISTIAHELGHSMHSYYSSKAQNAINANYTIMVAEVASTVNEILLANYLINKETDNKKKAALINEQLDMIRATLYRQAMFAEFEKETHQKHQII